MPIGPSRRSRYWPPKRSQPGKRSSSMATGNSQSGESSAADGSGAAPDWTPVLGAELVWALTSPGVALIPTKRTSAGRAFVFIEIAPLHRGGLGEPTAEGICTTRQER